VQQLKTNGATLDETFRIPYLVTNYLILGQTLQKHLVILKLNSIRIEEQY